MNRVAAALLRIPLVVSVVAAVLVVAVPAAMARYQPAGIVRPGLNCERTGVVVTGTELFPPGFCKPLTDHYHLPFLELLTDAALRSLALILGAAVLALVIGALLGLAAALARRRAVASGGIVAATSLLAAVPAFFVAYFLQIAVIVLSPTSGAIAGIPVFGFGYDAHLILPLIAVSLPAIAYTAQLTATRMQDVLESDFITTATAKGLPRNWIVAVHALPHVRPVLLEALGSGLRVSVASLPIIEILFIWRGIGQLVLEAVLIQDAAMFIASGIILATLFTTLSTVADLARPRAIYRI